jgi:hypothetical protein
MIEDKISIGGHFKEMEKLLEKYKEVEKNTIVMDDYDGGRINMVRSIISDLEEMNWWDNE